MWHHQDSVTVLGIPEAELQTRSNNINERSYDNNQQ
jgi:hypothetical protein